MNRSDRAGPVVRVHEGWRGAAAGAECPARRVIAETVMKTHELRQKFGRGVAAAALCATFALGASAASAAGNDQPVVVAQAVVVAPTMVVARPYPDYMSRAVAAAAESPEALRRYLWRTRMIYNFYYPDFIPNR